VAFHPSNQFSESTVLPPWDAMGKERAMAGSEGVGGGEV
jgi:hypothetical protein